MNLNLPTLCILALAVFAYIHYAQAIGCGEPLFSSTESCNDWQCSRNVSSFCVRGVGLNESCGNNTDCYLELECGSEGRCVKAPHATKNIGIGLVGAVLAVLCFGSSFVPIKRYKRYAGDGIFTQFAMCFGRFMVGLVILFTRENQTFYPMAALGGAFWSLGNVLSVPIIQCIGMGLGIAIWGTTNMLLGWASGKFGIWGVKKEHSDIPALEYIGVVASFISIILFVFVQPHYAKKKTPEEEAAEEAEKAGTGYSALEHDSGVRRESDSDDDDGQGDERGQYEKGSEYRNGASPTPASQGDQLQSAPGMNETDSLLSNDKGAHHQQQHTQGGIVVDDQGAIIQRTTNLTSPIQTHGKEYSPAPSSAGAMQVVPNTNPLMKTKGHGRIVIADVIGKGKARVIGVVMALIAGALFGICMDPVQHEMDHYGELSRTEVKKYSPYGLDYVFANNVGAMGLSFVVLTIYMIFKLLGLVKSEKYFEPVEHDKILLPAFANGAIGACGSAAWFFANQNLGLIVSFPIIAAGPGIVSALWGVIVFHEIKGIRNFIVLTLAFVAVLTASLCSAFAKNG